MKMSVVTIPVAEVLKNRCSSADRDINNATWPTREQQTRRERGKQRDNEKVQIGRFRKQPQILGTSTYALPLEENQ